MVNKKKLRKYYTRTILVQCERLHAVVNIDSVITFQTIRSNLCKSTRPFPVCLFILNYDFKNLA